MRDDEDYVLHITDKNSHSVKIRSQKNYISDYDSKDDLHKFLDKLTSSQIADLLNGQTINVQRLYYVPGHYISEQKKIIKFLTFNVIFDSADNDSVLRIYSNNELIDEILADKIFKKIQVNLKYQNNINFKFFSKSKQNHVTFLMVQGATKTSEQENKFTSRYFFVYDDVNIHSWRHCDHYPWWIFGGEIYKEKLFNLQSITFSSDLADTGDKKEGYSVFKSKQTKYKPVNCLHIAKFRPGIMCMIMIRPPKTKPDYGNIVWQDIFDDAQIDVNNNVMILQKNKRTIKVPLYTLMKTQAIKNYHEYFDFIVDSARFYPSYFYYF